MTAEYVPAGIHRGPATDIRKGHSVNEYYLPPQTHRSFSLNDQTTVELSSHQNHLSSFTLKNQDRCYGLIREGINFDIASPKESAVVSANRETRTITLPYDFGTRPAEMLAAYRAISSLEMGKAKTKEEVAAHEQLVTKDMLLQMRWMIENGLNPLPHVHDVTELTEMINTTRILWTDRNMILDLSAVERIFGLKMTVNPETVQSILPANFFSTHA